MAVGPGIGSVALRTRLVAARSALPPDSGGSSVRQGHFHLHVSAGGKGAGAEHAQYIAREGRFTPEKYGEIGEHEVGNLPEWARGSAARFFAAADDYERANGNTYREFEMSLPRDLPEAEWGPLVRQIVAEQIGSAHAYSWAIHEPKGHNPHVHIMYSERTLDGIERGPEHYFKRANTKNPERGGHLKSDRFAGRGGPQAIERLRERWAEIQNVALERAGLDVRVDHRSLEAQGIKREPGRHRGPAVSGIEARGEVAEVSVRREAERVERVAARKELVAEVRVVTREEMAVEREAARERRELAREVTGADRALVLPLVEADRREQIGRAQAAAERRVERRQGLGVGELRDKLVGQARALRERIGREIGRVKAWVAERFPEPLQRLKDRSRDLFDATLEKARGARGRSESALEKVPDRAPSGDKKRGRFDGLRLRAERSAAPEERDVSRSARPSMARESSPRPVRDPVAEALNQSVDRYARAWVDAWRMREKDLPVLEHQKTELKRAGEELDQHRPGAKQDLTTALRHEPSVVRIMTELEGAERTRGLLAGIEHEARVRRDPNLRAERLVKEWTGLEEQRKELSGWQNDGAREKVKGQMRALAQEFKLEPQLELAVKRRVQELGINAGSRLGRVLQEPNLERALSIVERDRGRSRGLSL